jgi:predicted ATPase
MVVQFIDFLGRASEVESLLQAFNRASRGDGAVAWVVGDAGIGKTRLCTELRARVVEAGGTAVTGHCLQFVNAPYLPFVDVHLALFADLPLIAEQRNQPMEPR